MGQSFYTTDGQQQQGPYSPEQLSVAGLEPDALVWSDGWAEWRRADTIPALASAVRRPQHFAAPSGYNAPVYQQPPDRSWSVHDQGRQFGPHTLMEIAQLVGAGTISPAAMAWQAGAAQWVPVSTLVPMPTFATGTHYAGPANQGAGNKVAAGICGILLGCFGVHKFILGFPLAGGIMLAATVLTCGYGGIVVGIIGLIEGIIYLSKSDADFHRTYVIQKRQWF